MSAKWKDKKENDLRRLYPTASKKELISYFKQSWNSIVHKASRIGLSRRRVKEVKKVENKLTNGEMVKYLEEKGYTLVKAATIQDKKIKIDLTRWDGKTMRIGVCSDTHFGSKYQQLTHLHTFYNFCKQKGVEIILNCGDVCEGNGKLYRGQIYEMFLTGADDQIAYAVENYPKIEGITTYCIAGSHDTSYLKTDGLDILKAISKERKDIIYLGQHGAYVTINGIKFYLIHPDGGVPYARSYRMQKIIEGFSPGEKPQVLLLGHLHITCILDNYRSIVGIHAGCFQAQTTYLKAKGLQPEIGGYILEINTSNADIEDGIVQVKTRWIPFHKAIPNDY